MEYEKSDSYKILIVMKNKVRGFIFSSIFAVIVKSPVNTKLLMQKEQN